MNALPLLVKAGLIKSGDVALFEDEARRDKTSVESVLEKHGISIENVLKVAGDHYQLPTRIIPPGPISHAALAYLPLESAQHYKFVPIGINDGALEIGLIDPDNIQAMDALQCPPPDSPVDILSGGERRRVALAKLLLPVPDRARLKRIETYLTERVRR